MDLLPSTSNDVGLLSEWQLPDGSWEIVTADEVEHRMERISNGIDRGPASHASPPGTVSGMTEVDAVRQARAKGLGVLLDRQLARQRLHSAGWSPALAQRVLDSIDSARTLDELEARVNDVLAEFENERTAREDAGSSLTSPQANTAVVQLLCPHAAELT